MKTYYEETKFDGVNEVTITTSSDDVIKIELFKSEDYNSDSDDEYRIIRGDVFAITTGSKCKGCVIIKSLNEKAVTAKKNVKLCMETIKEYYEENGMTFIDFPCFFIINAAWKNVDRVLGTYVEQGFNTVDHLFDFENNYVLVNTSMEVLKTMGKWYYTVNLKFTDLFNLLFE